MGRKSQGIVGLLVAGLVFGAAQNCLAAEKIAYVDLSKTFEEYGKTKKYDEQLSSSQSAKEKELNQMTSEIKSLQDKMSLLNDKEKAAKSKELDEKKEKLQQLSQQMALDLRKERDEKLKEILQDIEKVVQEYAQKNGYDFVFNDRVLLYGTATADVTQAIIEQLNGGSSAGAPAAAVKK